MSTGRNIIKYCKIRFRLLSPLQIGSGENNVTDHDIIKDAQGKPFIPASAIAGYFRDALFRSLLTQMDKEYARRTIDSALGYVLINREENDDTSISDIYNVSEDDDFPQSKKSSLIFYDANINENQFHVTRRDQVALNERKSSVPGAKFDTEILEPDVTFDTYLEEVLNEVNAESMAEKILQIWSCDEVAFGAKTTRGMGAVEVEKIWEKDFDLNTPDGTKEWVDFSVYGEPYGSSFTENDEVTERYVSSRTQNTPGNSCTLTLSLSQKGGISIRRYTTGPSASPDNNSNKKSNESAQIPDYEQMTEHVRHKQNSRRGSSSEEPGWVSVQRPVIPGTSWAGAFRHHMKGLMSATEQEMECWFGHVRGKDKTKSIITFSDSIIEGASSKLLSRNAIDRFSGGTIDGALFTEKTYYGGHTKLKIHFREDVRLNENIESASIEKKYKDALAATIADLHAGFMAIGGLTAVGRGLFTVTAFNGEPFSGDAMELYELVHAYLFGKGDASEEGT